MSTRPPTTSTLSHSAASPTAPDDAPSKEDFLAKHLKLCTNIPPRDPECPICMRKYRTTDNNDPPELAVRVYPCKHTFGKNCFEKWINPDGGGYKKGGQHNACPMCKTVLFQDPNVGVMGGGGLGVFPGYGTATRVMIEGGGRYGAVARQIIEGGVGVGVRVGGGSNLLPGWRRLVHPIPTTIEEVTAQMVGLGGFYAMSIGQLVASDRDPPPGLPNRDAIVAVLAEARGLMAERYVEMEARGGRDLEWAARSQPLLECMRRVLQMVLASTGMEWPESDGGVR
ncbi:hypothetical protein K432DRAFT_405889 [Lepidopterella palustris CBS 459.81]|uniref:RING-type domain-containing protein n=1 Tax=Lepidopterella palustris CBS 459.81 TaxID=1314670 RepID=A0A8E2JE65_9PEZI|nr:hypothetical protein K432DRAFT_405889 [Lepidopterella palustris CBS 459.81]